MKGARRTFYPKARQGASALILLVGVGLMPLREVFEIQAGVGIAVGPQPHLVEAVVVGAR